MSLTLASSNYIGTCQLVSEVHITKGTESSQASITNDSIHVTISAANVRYNFILQLRVNEANSFSKADVSVVEVAETSECTH